MDKIITVLGYKNFITEMNYAPDCALSTYFDLLKNKIMKSKFDFMLLKIHFLISEDTSIIIQNKEALFLYFLDVGTNVRKAIVIPPAWALACAWACTKL